MKFLNCAAKMKSAFYGVLSAGLFIAATGAAQGQYTHNHGYITRPPANVTRYVDPNFARGYNSTPYGQAHPLPVQYGHANPHNAGSGFGGHGTQIMHGSHGGQSSHGGHGGYGNFGGHDGHGSPGGHESHGSSGGHGSHDSHGTFGGATYLPPPPPRLMYGLER